MASLFLNSFVVFGVLNACVGLQFSADIVTDLNRDRLMWKVSGDWQFARSGSDLKRRIAQNYLPSGLKNSNFDRTSGIWALFPTPKTSACAFQENERLRVLPGDKNHHNRLIKTTSTENTNITRQYCDLSAYARFQCTLNASSILKSVTLRYNMGGNAVIRIGGQNGQYPVVYYAKNMQSGGWLSLRIGVKGELMLLEAHVEKTGDYVLIDKIAIETQEFEMTNGPKYLDATTKSASGFMQTGPNSKTADVTSEETDTMNGKCTSLRGASPSVAILVTWLTISQAVLNFT